MGCDSVIQYMILSVHVSLKGATAHLVPVSMTVLFLVVKRHLILNVAL